MQADQNLTRRLPDWLKKRKNLTPQVHRLKAILRKHNLHTVCEEARCPNLSECFGQPTATFMLMGDLCTRACAFCSVSSGRPKKLNPQEPESIAKVVKEMGLAHVVLTSVNRDDLQDGGAAHFAKTIQMIAKSVDSIVIEVLTPDFMGRLESVDTVCDAKPAIFNHNTETVPRLYRTIRPKALYERSLNILKRAKNHPNRPLVKSGLMLGLGEKEEELINVMRDLREAGTDILTLGQYLQPTNEQISVVEYIKQETFDRYAVIGKELGFKQVFSGPYVRSSYQAELKGREILFPSTYHEIHFEEAFFKG